MTNDQQPEDITARLDRLEQRVNETWERATLNTGIPFQGCSKLSKVY